jgi:UDP-N-acetylglucosamine--N-acetylmuramyl-(pentapeptide) pyrophosphoryl-undecaprenol N-acetylglucosamine transferase
MNKKLKIIISGGGTGGHIYPAVAVAQTLQRKHPDVEILFVGAKDRMEIEKVPKAGYAIIGLWISGLQRSLSLKNILFPFKVIHSVWKSLSILKAFHADAAIGFGGYASGAMLYAATMKKIPTVIHEQNSYAGITNKILKNRVDTICVAYDHMEQFFPARKIVRTGNPIRQDLNQVEQYKAAAYKHFGLDAGKKTILIIGGSLGARTINQSIQQHLQQYTEAGVQLLWQTGKSFYQNGKTLVSEKVKVYEFIYDMHLAYAVADIVISRAGALSIAELAHVKKPVILVPSPNVAEDHQTKNAMALVERQAAILVKDGDAMNTLADEALNLLNNEVKQVQLKNNIATFDMPDAAERIVDELLKLLRKD